MSRRARCYAACSLLLLVGAAGCRHKEPAPAPVAATAPPLTVSSITVVTPLPSVPPESAPDVRPAPVEPSKPAAVAPVKRTRRRRRKPAAAVPVTEQTQSTPNPAAEAAGTEVSGAIPTSTAVANAEAAAPALGELSTGTPVSIQERVRVLGEIQGQETRLGKLKEPATADGKAIDTQVRAFLTKARQAVAENDLDGALTLNTKARVLLDELESE